MTLLVLIPVAEVALIFAHEFGHFAVARLLGVPARLRFRWYGVAVAVPADALTRRRDFAIAAGGPALSLLLAVDLWNVSRELAVVSAFYGVVALTPLPFKCQDGYRMLRAAL